ncbi:type-1 angiotensin II receptor [Hydra vulgaris]|uniref:Type-1 angiotensin II receptor n=1 Tax=Hydra vulgaris TaxID=6087 RepID=A0ABM4B5N6_HYDVU
MSLNATKTNFEESYNVVEIIIVVLFSIIFALGTVGNFFVIFYFGVKLRPAVPEFLFCALAVVDFFASVFNPLLYVYWTLTRYKWYFGYWACKFLVPIGTIATTMSGGIFVVLSFDRQRTIVYPFKRHFKLVYIKLSIFLILIYALVMNAHYALNITLNVETNKCGVPDTRKKAYLVPSIFYFFINVCTLFVVINFTNYRIFSKMVNQSPTSTLFLGSRAKRRKKDNYRIIRLLIALTTVFFFLTVPRDILQFVFLMSWSFGKGLSISKSILTLNSFLKVINVANSCMNPLIYYWMHFGFKRFIKRSCGIKSKLLIRGRTSEFNSTKRFSMASLKNNYG